MGLFATWRPALAENRGTRRALPGELNRVERRPAALNRRSACNLSRSKRMQTRVETAAAVRYGVLPNFFRRLRGNRYQETEAQLLEKEQGLHYLLALGSQMPWTADAKGQILYIDTRWL